MEIHCFSLWPRGVDQFQVKIYPTFRIRITKSHFLNAILFYEVIIIVLTEEFIDQFVSEGLGFGKFLWFCLTFGYRQ